MKDKARYLVSHPLISGSFIIFAGSFVANIFNYLFNLSMGRFLSVDDYGLLITLTAFVFLFSTLNLSLINIFAKFSIKYLAKKNKGEMRGFLVLCAKFVVFFSVAVFLILLLLSSILGNFLHVENFTFLFLMYLYIFFNIVLSLPSGILQGQMRFYLLSSLGIFQPITKFVLGLGLVLLGFKLFGSLMAILVSIILTTFVVVIVILKNYRLGNSSVKVNEKELKKELFGYGSKLFLTSIGIALLSNTDIILVRHFFTPMVSGQYAALSLMGKAIFYFSSPINFVFFPLVALKKEKNEKIFGTLMLATGIVALMSISLSFVYFMFPGLVLSIFFPAKEYRMLTAYLGPFSLYILMFSIASLYNSFFLSIGKTGVYKITLAAALLQIFLIYIFHNSIFQIIGILFVVTLLLLFMLLIYYKNHDRD